MFNSELNSNLVKEITLDNEVIKNTATGTNPNTITYTVTKSGVLMVFADYWTSYNGNFSVINCTVSKNDTPVTVLKHQTGTYYTDQRGTHMAIMFNSVVNVQKGDVITITININNSSGSYQNSTIFAYLS